MWLRDWRLFCDWLVCVTKSIYRKNIMKSDIIYIVTVCLFTESAASQKVPSSYSFILKRPPRQSSVNDRDSCTLPGHPDNGRWSILNGEGEPGGKIPINSVLRFQCNKGYKLSTPGQYKVCDDNWDSNIPQCEKLCPPIKSTSKTTLKCIDRRGNATSCTEATEGSYLTYKCARFYETPFGYRKTLLCLDGTWNYAAPVCQPVCGKKTDDDAIPLIYGGKVKDIIEYPWVIALFLKMGDNYMNICGGTMIAPNIVVSAAHCVTNGYGDVLSKEDYLLAAGKLYNRYKDSRDISVQYSEVSRIVVHSSYRGDARRYLGDIAILVTKRPFVLSELVRPVCFNDVNNIYLHAGSIGVVAGFGITEDGLPSDQLRTLEIPYKYETICTQELPRDWADKYSMIDKICAGFYNQSISVCKGDSGNGLVFRNPEDNRYYIHGIVSIGPQKGGQCNIQLNSLYTKVPFYYDFVDREIIKHHVEDCVLPPYPEHGYWTVENEERKPGDNVPSNTVLKYTCNKNYELSDAAPMIECSSLTTIPTCQLLCPTPSVPHSTDYTCATGEGKVISCSKATENATLSYTCPQGYAVAEGNKVVRKCKKGAWGPPLSECRRIEATSVQPGSSEAGNFPKVICTYASWQSYKGFNPEDLNATLCNYVVYAFIGLLPNGKVRIQDPSLETEKQDRGLYRRVTGMKQRNSNLKVLLSVGGSGVSNYSLYSGMAADRAKRAAFISSAADILQTYNFDGLDIEWHVPEREDMNNYITLLREAKEEMRRHGWLLTATVRSHLDNTGYNGTQMNEILDWVNVKTYDMYGEWSKYTGQNSALYPSSVEYEWEKQNLNIEASARNWVQAGIDKNKLAPSIAFYGKSFTLQDKNNHGLHAPITGGGPGEAVAFLRYSEICSKYANFTRVWDNEQKNPYKYSENIWFGYDDEESVKIKAAYIKQNGYFGVHIWPVDGDDVHGKCGVKQILLKAIHEKLHDA